jgi:hypothetical protein
MLEFSKAEKRLLREIASAVYESEAQRVLEGLEAKFLRWRAGEVASSELLAAIHEFHQVGSRDLWSRYQSLKEPEIVARGIALGFLPKRELPAPLLEKLAPLVEFFARNQ